MMDRISGLATNPSKDLFALDTAMLVDKAVGPTAATVCVSRTLDAPVVEADGGAGCAQSFLTKHCTQKPLVVSQTGRLEPGLQSFIDWHFASSALAVSEISSAGLLTSRAGEPIYNLSVMELMGSR
jgi:hypothetical protein